MVRQVLICFLCGVGLDARAELAQDPNPTATIVGTNREFDSLQEAIDGASAGDTIQLHAGRFDERVTISKSIALVGASPGTTILGPTEQSQIEISDQSEKLSHEIDSALRNLEQSGPNREPSAAETELLRSTYERLKIANDNLGKPILSIDQGAKVNLRSLQVTMPLTPREGSGLPGRAAIQVKEAKLSLRDVAIVGCMAEGIDVTGDAELIVDDCLVAACWGTGISASHPNTAKVHIKDSDIRNNYHYNIGLGVEECIIEDCRISGTAWSGISTGAKSVRIERNALFHNQHAIYSAGERGIVRGNLIYDNGGGASCWYRGKPIYESNIFYSNKKGSIFVAGPAEPVIRKNLFVAGEQGLSYRPAKTVKQDYPVAERFRLEENVFWEVENPLSITQSTEDDAKPEPRDLPEGNEVVDPQLEVVQDQLMLGNKALAKLLDIEAIDGMSLKSRWPITQEEEAMIPDNGLIDSNLWKKRPKLDL